MYCTKCGAKIGENGKFCPKCGAAVPQGAGTELDTVVNAAHEPVSGEQGPTKNSFTSKFWNHPVFTMLAVKFGNLLDVFIGIVCCVLGSIMFSDTGVFAKVLAVIFLFAGIVNVITGVKQFFAGNKEPDTPEELNKKKRNLCIGAVVIVLGLVLLHNTGGGTYSIVKQVSFDDIGTETVGEIIRENVKNAEWSQKKLDSSSKLVYVEGYCPRYGETMKVTFYYEKLDDGSHEVTLQKIEFPDSGESYDNALSAGMIWAALYEEEGE